MPNRWLYLVIALGVLAIEVVIALCFRDWPFIRGSLGDVLVIVLLYFLLRWITPFRPASAALTSVAIGFLAEALQLMDLVDRLGISRTGLLGIVLGSRFSFSDLLMYVLGGAIALFFDRILFEPKS